MRRRNYPKPQGLLSTLFQSPPHLAPSKQGSRPEKIDVLEAMHIAIVACSMDVKPETIRNYFRHCQIRTIDADVTPVPEEPLIDPEVIKDLKKQVQKLHY